ncbi:MAG TPA: peptidoglycan DD-metalloendopeptidase family protein [Vicinamibacterales bacterium]|nr:peptidoglycan DD-metalloendopeptidase family protein [Vicinamibacterales bacterium]
MSTGSDPIAPVESGSPAAVAGPSAGNKQTPEQLRALAAQFESLLLTQMMNAMRSSMFSDDDEDQNGGFATGPLGDAMYSELGLALSRAGGFGLTDSILAPLMREAGEAGVSMPLGGSLPLPLSIDAPAMAMPSSAADALSRLSESASASARVTSAFGWRQDPIDGTLKFHKGTDIAMPEGQDVPAAQAGRVVFAGERSGYGVTVEIDHGAGVVTRYAHLSDATVAVGDAVREGQTIAHSGATGRVTGPHLHFEVLDQGQPVDPSSGLARLGSIRE